MKTQWLFHDLPAIFLGRPLPNCTGKTQTFHEKRRKRRLFFCGFLIVLLGHPPQTFHEKAWAFQDFPAIFLGHPLPNCIGKTQTFHEKRWQRPLPFCGFLIVLLGYPLQKLGSFKGGLGNFPRANCTGKTQTFHEKRRQRPLFFCGFLIVLLGYPLQKFHEKAWFLSGFSSSFPMVPPTKLYWKNANFPGKKRWQRPLFFCGFLIVLLGYPLQKLGRVVLGGLGQILG